MNPLKQLAGQTAIYGLSSIVARIVNFFMVPVYTRVLATGSYGRASELLAYVAILQVVLIFGLENGFFRFANKHKDKSQLLYTTSVAFVTGTSVIFLLLVILFSGKLGNLMGYPGKYLI